MKLYNRCPLPSGAIVATRIGSGTSPEEYGPKRKRPLKGMRVRVTHALRVECQRRLREPEVRRNLPAHPRDLLGFGIADAELEHGINTCGDAQRRKFRPTGR